MRAAQQTEFSSLLETICSQGHLIEAAVVTTTDGIPLDMRHQPGIDMDQLAATTALARNLSERLLEAAKLGVLRRLTVGVQVGMALIWALNEETALVVLTTKGADLGYNQNLLERELEPWLRT